MRSVRVLWLAPPGVLRLSAEGFLRSLLTLLLVLSMIQFAAAQPTKRAPYATSKSSPSESEPGRPIQRALQKGRLDDLRWPDFADYRIQLEKFYRASHYSFAWIENSGPSGRALQMIDALRQADTEGLDPEDYDASRWPVRIALLAANHEPEDEARFDLALTVSAMRYISDVHIGRVNPQHASFALGTGRQRIDLATFLRELADTRGDLTSEIASIEPPLAGYKATRKALLHYMALAKDDVPGQLPPPVGIVYRGGYYDHMPELATRLRRLGELPPTAIIFQDATTYDGPLLDAVRSFQQRHGLRATGNLTSETIDEINVPLSARVDQLRVSLERYRWPRASFREPFIVVNLPEFRLRAYDADGHMVLSMGVDVGDAYDFQTPVFQDEIRYLVFRPYWYVPATIQRDEVVPDMASDRDFAREIGIDVLTPDGRVIPPAGINSTVIRNLRAGRYRVRQQPGPLNALGLVKIVFPNPYDVYMHGTPTTKDMFSGDDHALSHGCIHLERPAELAQWLLRDQPGWTSDRIEAAMHHGQDNRTVFLKHPVPIMITYETTGISADGKIQFYSDIYGHDADLARALSNDYLHPKVPTNLLYAGVGD